MREGSVKRSHAHARGVYIKRVSPVNGRNYFTDTEKPSEDYYNSKRILDYTFDRTLELELHICRASLKTCGLPLLENKMTLEEVVGSNITDKK